MTGRGVEIGSRDAGVVAVEGRSCFDESGEERTDARL